IGEKSVARGRACPPAGPARQALERVVLEDLEHPAGDVRAGPARRYRGRGGSARLKVHPTRTDEEVNMRLQSLALLVLAGIALTLYIMRSRSRQGQRTPQVYGVFLA